MKVKYLIGEGMYHVCRWLWQVTASLNDWRGRLAHVAAIMQEPYLKAKRFRAIRALAPEGGEKNG